jgi:hypothetical protein
MASPPRQGMVRYTQALREKGSAVDEVAYVRADAPRSPHDDHRDVGGPKDVRDIRCNDSARPFQ